MEQSAGQMKRIKLIVAYDGTDYCGWQIQPSGITIEEVLNRELSTLLGEEIRVTGASRTDSGVHSLGNVAVFDTKTRIPADKLCYALNQRLPEDIVVQSSCEVARDFHPRRCYSEKTYEYCILNRKIEDGCGGHSAHNSFLYGGTNAAGCDSYPCHRNGISLQYGTDYCRNLDSGGDW